MTGLSDMNDALAKEIDASASFIESNVRVLQSAAAELRRIRDAINDGTPESAGRLATQAAREILRRAGFVVMNKQAALAVMTVLDAVENGRSPTEELSMPLAGLIDELAKVVGQASLISSAIEPSTGGHKA